MTLANTLVVSLICAFAIQCHAAEAPATELPSPTAQTSLPPLLPPVQDLPAWTLDSLNSAEWSDNLPEGQFPVYARLQVLLARKFSSPGAIDGRSGLNTTKALSAYQIMQGLSGNGKFDRQTWQALNQDNTTAAFIEYTLTARDIQQPYAKSIPNNYAEQAKMKGLYYTRITEMLAEKFHMDEIFLQQINPSAKFNQIGEKIIVANISNELPKDIYTLVAHKGTRQLFIFNAQNKIIAAFPATIGSDENPSPSGTHRIAVITFNPHYSYNPKNFIQADNFTSLLLPPGPNNPVGNIWIGLSRPSFGIHGTPNPALISKTASHGCIRLTNWDANNLSKIVRKGMTVRFLE